MIGFIVRDFYRMNSTGRQLWRWSGMFQPSRGPNGLVERWSRIFEQNFRVDKWNLCRGLGCRAEGQLGEVSLVGRGAVKALMGTLGIVKIEIASNGAAGFADALVGAQIYLLVFDSSPQTLNKHVVSPSPLAIHADRYSAVGKSAGEHAPVNWLP